MHKYIVILLFSIGCFGQAKYYAYIPLKTYHYDRSDMGLWFMEKNEGGNIGLIIMRREGISEIQFGVLNNSYGYFSIVAMAGVTKRVGIFRIGASGGVASGYRAYYWQFRHTDTKPKNIMTKTGVLPQVAINISLENTRISPLLVISPYFVNGGLKITLN